MGLEQGAEESNHIDSQGVDSHLSLFDLNDLVVFQLLQQSRKLLDCVQRILKVVLVSQQRNDELGLLVYSLERDSLFEAELLPEGGKRTPNKGFRHESVRKRIAIVRKHEYLLELISSANCKFKYVFFGLGSYSTQIAYAVSDGDC